MKQIQIELSRGKNLILITDNEKLVSLIHRQDIVLQDYEDKFHAIIIVQDLGYRRAITFDSWVNKIISDDTCGSFILSRHYNIGRMLFDGHVYVNGTYNLKLIGALENLSISTFARFQDRRNVSVQIGKIRTLYEAQLKNEQLLSNNENDIEMINKEPVNKENGIDEIYNDALKIVMDHQMASVSLLQRKLRIGYTRAARLIDSLEENGVVGEYIGSKPREVLLKSLVKCDSSSI